MKIKSFGSFINEDYFKGLSKTTVSRKKAQIAKQVAMSDDDPDAYKELPGDTKGKKNIKQGAGTKEYHKLYSEDVNRSEILEIYEEFGLEENLVVNPLDITKDFFYVSINGTTYGYEAKGGGNIEDLANTFKGMLKYSAGKALAWLKKNANLASGSKKDLSEALMVFPSVIVPKMVSAVFGPRSDVSMREELTRVISDAITPILKKYKVVVAEAAAADEDDKKSTDRSPIDDDAVETGLKNKSNDTGVPIGILRAVMRRGMAAWKSGHRPGVGQNQWAYARVNAFLTKGDGTWGGADKDLAKEVRDGGHDKKLK